MEIETKDGENHFKLPQKILHVSNVRLRQVWKGRGGAVASQSARMANPAEGTPCGAESTAYFTAVNHSRGNAVRTAGLFAIAAQTGKVAVICSHIS